MVRVPILTYHSIDNSGSVVSVSQDRFQRQMRSLHESGFQTVRLLECLNGLQSGTPLPERPLVITFDDAYRSVYEHAIPVLDDLGFTATVFAIGDHVGGYNDWPGHDAPFGRAELMDADTLRDLRDHGFEIGSHTSTHPDLTTLTEQGAECEIRAGIKTLQDLLGAPVECFAYPYGRFDETILAAARRYTRCACTTRLGRVDAATDMHALNRIDAFYLRDSGAPLHLPETILDAGLAAWQVLRDLRERLI